MSIIMFTFVNVLINQKHNIMKKTKINYNSTKNQQIKEKLVQRDIYANVSGMVEYILRSEGDDPPFTYDDIQNMYDEGPDAVQEWAEYNLDSEELEDFNAIESNDDKLQLAMEKGFEPEPHEIYEWWIVDSMLGEDLLSRGEPVISDGYHYIWGRTCTGQAILLDGVISRIAEDLQILEGQANEWNV